MIIISCITHLMYKYYIYYLFYYILLLQKWQPRKCRLAFTTPGLDYLATFSVCHLLVLIFNIIYHALIFRNFSVFLLSTIGILHILHALPVASNPTLATIPTRCIIYPTHYCSTSSFCLLGGKNPYNAIPILSALLSLYV